MHCNSKIIIDKPFQPGRIIVRMNYMETGNEQNSSCLKIVGLENSRELFK